MKDEHVVSALIRKYAEIKGKLIVAEKHSRKLRADLTHLDAVLRLFRTNYETAKIIATRPKRPIRWGKRGKAWRTALEILKRTNAPMTAREIGLQVARKLGVETEGEPLRYLVTSIGDSLQRGTKKGIIRQVGDYYRQDGTYVQPYTRSSPNGTVMDNYSFHGNVNPYTGSVGTNNYTHDQTSPYYQGPDMYGHIGHGDQ